MATRTIRFDGLKYPSADRMTITASRIALAGVTVVFVFLTLAGNLPSLDVQLMIYLVGMIGLNLPHGGYEHFSNLRQRGVPFGARYVVLYLLFVAGFIGLFFVLPIVALALAFATAVFKGGHGDLHVMDGLIGTDHLQYRFQRFLAAFVRGGAIMIVPLVFWPEIYYTFASLMVSVFDPGAAGTLLANMEAGRPILGGLFGVALVAHLGVGLAVAGLSRTWLADAGESLLLTAYFAVVPVVVSIGLYFPLWYSLRQSGRDYVVRTEDDGLPLPAVWGVLVVGALVTGLVAATLWVLAPNPLPTEGLLAGIVAFYTIFVCIIALPHVVVGEWLDFGRGIWYVP